MTEHIKALPRLFDELNSSHLATHGLADFAIAVGFAMVNHAVTFISPDRNKLDLTTRLSGHSTQPKATERTIKKIEVVPSFDTAG